MTYDEMVQAINDAPDSEKLETAERALAEYDGDDKEFVRPWIMEMAALDQTV